MADLNDLFKVAPGMASFFTGQQQSLDQTNKQTENARLAQVLADLQQKHGQNEQSFPLDLETKRLANQSTLAELPGKQAKSLQEQLTAQKGQQTFTSDVAATNSKNNASVSKDSSEQYDRYMSHLTQFGAVLDKVPVPMRVATLKQMLDGAGYSNMPQQLFQMVSADPQRMPQALREAASAMGQMKAQQSPQYHQGMDVAELTRKSAEKVAAGHDATAIRVEQMREQARVAAAKEAAVKKSKSIYEAVRSGDLKLDQMPAAFDFAIREAATPEEKTFLAQQRDKAAAMVLAKPAVPKEGTVSASEASGLPAAAGPANPYADPGAAPAVVAPPPGAIEKLKVDPKLRDAFDAKYGKGAALKVLGK
jgi:hypothetical protein